MFYQNMAHDKMFFACRDVTLTL